MSTILGSIGSWLTRILGDPPSHYGDDSASASVGLAAFTALTRP
jgi:hypothetical protein